MHEMILFTQVKDEKLIKIVGSLADEIWNEHYIPIVGKNLVKYMLEKFQSKEAISAQIKEGSIYYLINHNDSYVGYFSIILKDKHLFLSKIYIKADSRRKGIGKKAFQFIEDIAVNNNLTEIILSVNKDNINSIKTYSKTGFVITDSNVKNIGSGFVMDDYQMKKTLVSSNL